MEKDNRFKIGLFLFALLFTLSSFGQDKTLVGKVTTFDSIPLIGADILVKSTGQQIKTDTAGLFQVLCNTEDRITIEADGFYSKKIKIENGIRMIFVNLTLKKGDKNFQLAEQYVNVGYGHIKSDRLLNAVSSLNNKNMDFTMYNNMFDLIQGQFPGVAVEGNNIVVRGIKTLYGSESNAALIVIDGAIVTTQDLANVSPNDVQSVNVLKDGSSSVYGSRGANGVVIIETKKGK